MIKIFKSIFNKNKTIIDVKETNNLEDKFYMYFKKQIDAEIKKEKEFKAFNL